MTGAAPQAMGLRPRRPPAALDFALPTINIIFLLTLYFLLTGTLVDRHELGEDLPVSLETRLERLPRPLLSVLSEGGYLLDGAAVPPEALLAAARQAVVEPARVLNVVLPRQASARPVFALLAELAAAGVPLRIVTERDPGEVVLP